MFEFCSFLSKAHSSPCKAHDWQNESGGLVLLEKKYPLSLPGQFGVRQNEREQSTSKVLWSVK